MAVEASLPQADPSLGVYIIETNQPNRSSPSDQRSHHHSICRHARLQRRFPTVSPHRQDPTFYRPSFALIFVAALVRRKNLPTALLRPGCVRDVSDSPPLLG